MPADRAGKAVPAASKTDRARQAELARLDADLGALRRRVEALR